MTNIAKTFTLQAVEHWAPFRQIWLFQLLQIRLIVLPFPNTARGAPITCSC